MRLAVTIENEDLEALVSRVYTFDKKPSVAAIQAARKALVEANPYLAGLAGVPPGTVLAVPEVAGAGPSAATQDAAPALSTAAVQQLSGAVALARQQLEADLQAEIADARQTAALGRSRELKGSLAKDQELTKELAATTKAAAARATAAQALQRYEKRAFAQLDKDLAELSSAFGAPG